MALSDLKTDLTSLKYGSKLPAVRHKMGNKVSQVSARIDDVKRLAVILTQAPGRKFAANQILLKNADIREKLKGIGPKSDARSVGKAVLGGLGAAFKATVGTGLFLTANAGKAGTGYHSINPSVALSYLDKAAMDKQPELKGFQKFLSSAIDTVNKISTAIGAKSANYHAGKEILGGAQFVSKAYIEKPIFQGGDPKGKGADQGKSKHSIGAILIGSGSVDGSKFIQRSDKYKEFEVGGKISDDQKYLETGKSATTGLEDIKFSSLKNYYKNGEGDKIQKSPVDDLPFTDEVDIIPFTFNFYKPGDEGNSFLHFRALLDSLSDSYTANWAGTKYVGRAEEFFNYTGFGRTMSFAFKVAAFSKEELKPIYEKLNFLVGGTAPTYGDKELFMRGTLLKLTIGDYIKNQNGFLSSVSLTWNTDYPWEIEGDLKVPHMLDVSCEFTPIHKFNPEFGVDSKKFIGV